jgi:hypothetical protein
VLQTIHESNDMRGWEVCVGRFEQWQTSMAGTGGGDISRDPVFFQGGKAGRLSPRREGVR